MATSLALTGLAGSVFASGLDAATPAVGSSASITDLYLFKGNQFAVYNTIMNKITAGPLSIAAAFPKLTSPFLSGVDAAVQVPGSSRDLYLFKGSQYVRYNRLHLVIDNGPGDIAAGWPGLAGTDFTYALDAAVNVPGSTTDVYLFKNDQALQYNIG